MLDTYEETVFKQLYDAVLKQDKEAVDAMRAMGVCLNMQWKRQNIATLLAAKDQRDAIHWLIDTFDFPLSSAVCAFAQVGNQNEVIKLIERGASKLQAIRGFACGDHDAVNDFISQDSDLSAAIQGYAFAGNGEKVNALLTRVPSDFNLAYAAREFAYNNMKSNVKLLLAWGADPGWVIQGFAMRGDDRAVNLLCESSIHWKHALIGYIAGGYFSLMSALLNQIKPDSQEFRDFIGCAKASLASMGYLKRLKKLSEDYPLNGLLDPKPNGLAGGGHSAEFDAWMRKRSNVLSQERRARIIGKAIYMYAAHGYPEKVAPLLEGEPDRIRCAILGYEVGAHEQEVSDLLSQHGYGDYTLSALQQVIDAGRLDRFTNLMRRSFDDNRKERALAIAESSLRRAGHLKDDRAIFRALFFVKDREIQAALKSKILPYPASLLARKVETNLRSAEQLTTTYALSDLQVFLFLTFKQEWHAWFLLGIQFVEEGRLIEDLFFLISAYVVGQPLNVTRRLCDDYMRIMPQLLRDSALFKLNEAQIEAESKKGWIESFTGALFGTRKISQKAQEQAIWAHYEARAERLSAYCLKK